MVVVKKTKQRNTSLNPTADVTAGARKVVMGHRKFAITSERTCHSLLHTHHHMSSALYDSTVIKRTVTLPFCDFILVVLTCHRCIGDHPYGSYLPQSVPRDFIDGSGPIFSMYCKWRGKKTRRWLMVGKQTLTGTYYTFRQYSVKVPPVFRRFFF